MRNTIIVNNKPLLVASIANVGRLTHIQALFVSRQTAINNTNILNFKT